MKKLMLIAAMALIGLPALAADEGAPGPGKGLRERIRERVLEKFDKDADGKLGPQERAAAREALVDRVMQRFDKDGDGKLSREELTQALGALRQKFQELRERRGGQGPRAGLGPRA
ncbi:MAG: EF-hand domain-containing protein [Planctomycetes bacterium]|nr:EF-hand domain-containing protein [Planctomycetota bacterium]